MTGDALRAGLAIVGDAVKERTTLPVLATVLCETVEGGLRLTASDLDQTLQTIVPADVERSGALCVPGKRLAGIAKSLPDGAVRLDSDGTTVKIACAKVKYDLRGMTPDQFPLVPEVSFESGTLIPARELATAADVSFAVSQEDKSRRVLTGVLWQCRNGRMRMVATDMHRLARKEAGSCCDGVSDVILPSNVLEWAAQVFGGGEAIEVGTAPNYLGFRRGTTLFVTRLVEGPYPPYEKILDIESKGTIVFDRAVLLPALKRLAVVAEMPFKVVCVFSANSCELTVQATDVGRATEDVPCIHVGEQPLTIAFNLHFLQDAASHIRSEQFQITYTDGDKPVRVTPIGDETHAQIIMPLRVA